MIRGDVADRDFCREAVAQDGARARRRSTCWSTTPPSRCIPQDFLDLSPEHFDETLKTNLYGYFHLAQAAAAEMKPGSAIINTGSVTGIDGSKELVDYSMTKGGIHAFTRALAGNLVPRGIRVNCVAPGPVWTPLNPSDKEPEKVAQFGAKTPMKRPAQPEEIAPAYASSPRRNARYDRLRARVWLSPPPQHSRRASVRSRICLDRRGSGSIGVLDADELLPRRLHRAQAARRAWPGWQPRSRFWVFCTRKTMRKVTMVVPVLMTSCQTSEKPKIGPVAAQTTTSASARTKAARLAGEGRRSCRRWR